MVKHPPNEKINMLRLSLLSCAFVVSIRNIATMAECGMQMIFFGIVAAIFFFFPTALVTAELSTAWPKEGGIYVWVKQAFGVRMGFWATWFQWTTMLVNVITMLLFVSSSFAFVFAPELANNKIFLFVVLFVILWISTLSSLRGIKANSLISSICFIGGVLIPGILIIVLGIIYISSGRPIHLNMAMTYKNIVPNFTSISTLVMLVGFSLSFNGIEASACHAGKVHNPKKSFPIALLTVVILALAINLLGAVSVASVIPKDNISLVSGIMDTFSQIFSEFNLKWLVPYVAILVAGGTGGSANAWLLGPVKGLLESAKNGELPPFFRKTNKHGIPARLLIMQGGIVSVLAAILLCAPTINMAFWIALALSMIIYVLMYMMMMVSGIYLRYKEPNAPRTFKIPGKKNIGMWITSILGLLMLVLIFVLGFIPPEELPKQNNTMFYSIIFGGLLLVFGIPFIIKACKKPNWVEPTEEDLK